MPTHLVTGAGSGIGAVVATRLHERGDHLVLVARGEDRAAALGAQFPGATTVVCDLADGHAVARFALPDVVVGLDSIVHAAGVVALGTVADLGILDWVEQLRVNLVAPAMLTRAALPALRSARGTVVFVNSGAGLFAHPEWGAYAASKQGLRALADSLRAEESPHGVRVTSVFPGRTATPMQEQVHAHEGKPYEARDWIDPGTVADVVLAAIDLPDDATMPEVVVKPR